MEINTPEQIPQKEGEDFNIDRWVNLKHLPKLVQIYARAVSRNTIAREVEIQEGNRVNIKGAAEGDHRCLKPSFFDECEGYTMNSFLMKILTLPYKEKKLVLDPRLVLSGNVIEQVKKGRGNCLDWSIAVALNYNVQLAQSPDFQDTEALIVPYNLESITRNSTHIPDHFGVVIVDRKKKKPLYYLLYGGLSISEEDFSEVIETEKGIERKMEKLKLLLNHEVEKEELRLMFASLSRIRSNCMELLEKSEAK